MNNSIKSPCAVFLKHVRLCLAEQRIFDNISLNIPVGEKVAILGKSGIGKSTLLKLISGIYQPTKGIVNNQAKRIGYVFQEPRLFPWLTVEQNIVEVMKAQAISLSKQKARLTSLLEKVGLTHCNHLYPHQLSGGMAQRVSLVRAFAINPDLLLLDEPFSALDANLTVELSQLLIDLVADKTTMLYVSHHVEHVVPIVDSCFVLQQNNLVTWYSLSTKDHKKSFLNQMNNNEVY